MLDIREYCIIKQNGNTKAHRYSHCFQNNDNKMILLWNILNKSLIILAFVYNRFFCSIEVPTLIMQSYSL